MFTMFTLFFKFKSYKSEVLEAHCQTSHGNCIYKKTTKMGEHSEHVNIHGGSLEISLGDVTRHFLGVNTP